MSNPPEKARLTPQAPGQQAEDVMHVSTFAIIKRGEDLLLEKKLRPKFTAGKWVLLSAIIQLGENPETAAKHIVKEQLGTDSTVVRLLQVQSYGDKHWDMCLVYGASNDGTETLHQDIELTDYFPMGKLLPGLRSDKGEVLQTLASQA